MSLPSTELSSSLELKALPKHLKYVNLDGHKTLPIIIMSHLTARQEKSLMSILRKYREVIGWTMTDIKGLSPTIVKHHIHLNKETKSKRDPRHGLNPIM